MLDGMDTRRYAELVRRTSSMWWFPRVEAVGLPVPKTLHVPCEGLDLARLMDGETPDGYEEMLNSVRQAADTIRYPVFIRTDQTSAKHDGPKAYRCEGPGDLPTALFYTFDHAFMAGVNQFVRAVMVREWLDLRAGFSAFHGHRIAREFRVFANAGVERTCLHPYWPETAIEFWSEDEPDKWREVLKRQNTIDTYESAMLRVMARRAADECGHIHPAWSVDLAQRLDGSWVLIDMACAEVSYHPEPCKDRR